MFLAQRTALEAGDPVGIDPAHDELAFFPLIYWPVVPGAAKPPQDAINKIDAYMKQGGTVLFDTRDAIDAPPGEDGAAQTPGMQTLRELLSSLDVPELEPVPRDHVLTKTFYLLRDFPGRFTSGRPGSKPCRARMTTRPRRTPRAAATASRRSSSPRTIWPAPGRSVPMARPCCRCLRASRGNANSRSGPASTS